LEVHGPIREIKVKGKDWPGSAGLQKGGVPKPLAESNQRWKGPQKKPEKLGAMKMLDR
jgi:hypothetical protein